MGKRSTFVLKPWPYTNRVSICQKSRNGYRFLDAAYATQSPNLKNIPNSTILSTKSLSDCNIRELKRLVQGDNRLSTAKITTDLDISLFKLVSKRTVRRYLKKLGYEYAVKIKKQ